MTIAALMNAARVMTGAGTLLCILLGAGCASSPPPRFYTLVPLPEAQTRAAALTAGVLAIGLGPVRFPGFLERPQLVARVRDTELALDEFERWGGRVEDDFVRVWSENLAHLLDNSQIFVFPSELRTPLAYRVVVEVLRFETAADTAWLKARWMVLDGATGTVLAVREDTYRQPVTAPGDAAARVAALSATLAEFSRAVADTLRQRERHPASG